MYLLDWFLLLIFLTSLAIFDDIGAIVIIALFYTSKVFVVALIVTVLCIPVLFFMNRRGVESRSLYIFIGLVVWVSMFKSGVYATLAGVLLAIFIPMESKTGGASPLKSLEHDLHHVVAFFGLCSLALWSGIVKFPKRSELGGGGLCMVLVLCGVLALL